MAHSILLSDVIELIFIDNTSYDLDEYCKHTGLDRSDLINSADSVETHQYYGDNISRTMAEIYNEVLEENLFDEQFNNDNDQY